MQRDMEETLGTQERFIASFQLLAREDGGIAALINGLLCPLAVFKRDGVLCMANQALLKETDLQTDEIAAGKVNLLNRVTDENVAILEAVEHVFSGRTTYLKQLSRPLELFCRNENHIVPDALRNALVFPLPDGEGRIQLGVIMLMR